MSKMNWFGRLSALLWKLVNHEAGCSSRAFQPRQRRGGSLYPTIPAMIELLEPRRVLSSVSAMPDLYMVIHDQPRIEGGAGVLGNDFGWDDPMDMGSGNTLTASLVTGPSNGLLTLNLDGGFVYTPTANWAGSDSFTYTAHFGGATSDPTTVTIDVQNSAPSAIGTMTGLWTPHDVALNWTSSCVTLYDADHPLSALTHTMMNNVQHGTLDYHNDGTFVYTPEAGYVGSDSFQVKYTDPIGAESEVATITLEVTNSVPVATDDSGYFDLAGAELVVDADEGVLANDTDADSIDVPLLTVELVDNGHWGTFSLNSDGSFAYSIDASNVTDPAFDYTDTFTYIACDGYSESGEATVTVSIGVAKIYKMVQTEDPANPFQLIDTQVDDTNGYTEIVVGERAERSLVIVGGMPPQLEVHWSVGGETLKSYGELSANIQTPLSDNDLSQIALSWFWTTSEGNQHVAVIAIVGTMAVVVDTDFNVQRPQVGIDVQQSIVTINNNGDAVGLGNQPGGGPNAGIILAASAPSIPGTLRWVQVLDGQTASRTLVNANGTRSFQGFHAASKLDVAAPYSDSRTLTDSPSEGTAGDVNLGSAVSITRNDSFTSYLMFKSNKPGSSWVPLRDVSWYWGFTVDRTTGIAQWCLTSASMGYTPPVVATSYPSWDGVLAGPPPWQ